MKTHIHKTIWQLSLAALILCAIIFGGCTPPNNYPVINSLAAEKERVTTSGSIKVECVAADKDGDNLDYAWSATGGSFSGAGPVVTWMAPNTAGYHTITVKVTDGKDGEATGQVTVDILVNRPPVIESLTADPPEVLQNKTTTIKCVASDTDGDELSYHWSAERGNFSGQGPTVTWTAPGACSTFLAKVIVTDGKGGDVSKELSIKVIKPG